MWLRLGIVILLICLASWALFALVRSGSILGYLGMFVCAVVGALAIVAVARPKQITIPEDGREPDAAHRHIAHMGQVSLVTGLLALVGWAIAGMGWQEAWPSRAQMFHLYGTLLSSLAAVVSTLLYYRSKEKLHEMLRQGPHRCSQCGYLLTGLCEPRCPECGTPFNCP